jgi:hypothetical protein
MLPAGSVLGEQARPVLGVRVDVPAALVPLLDPTDIVRKDLCHRTLALPDQPGIPLGAGNAELVDTARAGREAAVAEVEAEKVRVGRLRQGQRIAGTDDTDTPTRLTVRAVEGALTIKVRRLPFSPLPDGASGNPSLASDLAVVPTPGDKLQDQRDFLSCSHFATLLPLARVEKSANSMDSKSIARKGLRVRIPPRAPLAENLAQPELTFE